MVTARTLVRGASKLEQTTARDFSGGLNTYDSPLNLSSKYSIKLRNLFINSNGGLDLRFGTKLFASLDDTGTDVVAMRYFNTVILTVQDDGRLASVNATGDATIRWSAAIASTRPGAPPAWSPTSFASFTPFEGSMIVCNGIDKPLTVDEVYTVNYLADPATGSNVHVPRAKYCTTHNGYLVMAGMADNPSLLQIGAKGVAGVFVGDPGSDNDAVDFETAQYVTEDSPDITGLASFRDTLLVSYASGILVIKLGTYDASGNHVPVVSDYISDIGAINHNCIVPTGDNCYVFSNTGLNILKRTTLTGQLMSERASTLVGPDMRASLEKFSPANAERYVFAALDNRNQQVMLFSPVTADVLGLTDNDIFVHCFDKQSKLAAWATYDNMPFRSYCRSREGRLFFSAGGYIYVMGSETDPVYTDPHVAIDQPWSDGTYFSDGTGWMEPNNVSTGYTSQPWDDGIFWDDGYGWAQVGADVGAKIEFMWQSPWADLKQPARQKESRNLSFMVEGRADFSVGMLVDRFDTALLSMTFRNTDQPSNNLGIRPSNNEQAYGWPMRFNRMSMTINGRADNKVRIVSITMLYITGGYAR